MGLCSGGDYNRDEKSVSDLIGLKPGGTITGILRYFTKGIFPWFINCVGASFLCSLFNIANLMLSLTNGFELLGLTFTTEK